MLYKNCDLFPRGPILTVPYSTIDSIEGFSHGIATHLKMIHLIGLMARHIEFYAGIGNRKADQKVYDQAKIPKSRQVLIIWGNHSLIQNNHLSFSEVPRVLKEEMVNGKKGWKIRLLWFLFCIENSVDRVVGRSYATVITVLYNAVTECRKMRNPKSHGKAQVVQNIESL